MIQREVAVFLVVGTLTVLVDYASYLSLMSSGLVAVATAKGAGFVIGTLFAYFANRLWTFGHVTHGAGSAWRFMALYACTLLINVVANSAILAWFGYLTVHFAFLVATAISAALNFIGMKWFVFRKQSTKELQ